ncbi:hypothetical protein FNO01nite_02640 [Flavobacterium noncentrifugens]|nr:hypothetical protein [Flavobacterium noncentrifugens]GEP49592.1 hypothetical protein FNO01nite_02640 [Flavobacterium noncentrifugens]
MKQSFFISLSFLFFSLNLVAQDGKMVGATFWNGTRQQKKPLGSPYVQNMFAPATVDNIKTPANVRYNVYKDEFEFIAPKGDTLILDRIEDFGSITFKGSNKKYRLVVYTDKSNSLVNGYLMELYTKPNLVLYKKENINLTGEKIAKTTLERDMPAKYTKIGDTYFLKTPNGNTTEFPDGRKALVKLFPDKKQPLESYLKENKIDFDNESDLIKIVDFLTTN